MLDNLSSKLSRVIKTIRGEVQLTEKNMEEILRQIRLSLLEADVNFRVVRNFLEEIKQRAHGTEIHQSLNPSQQVIKIVHQELAKLLGGEQKNLKLPDFKPAFLILVGLQGSGKTTTAAKLGVYLKSRGKSVLLVSLDLKRLAAQEQLSLLAAENQLKFFSVTENSPQVMCKKIDDYARSYGYDLVLVDTAGRLHVDEDLMNELQLLKKLINPVETIYVADSLTGQDAVNSARIFLEKVDFDSIILTKLDADNRGGAALSIVSVTDRPIKFIGVGEKIQNLEPFYPERLASRILGMGDMLSLIEKAEREFDQKESEKMLQKMIAQEFTLDDFVAQLEQIGKLGSFREILGLLPDIGVDRNFNAENFDQKKIKHMVAVIRSMTREERLKPKIIDGRRRLRISRGSGRPVQEVNQLLRSFQQMQASMKKPFFRKLLKRLTFL